MVRWYCASNVLVMLLRGRYVAIERQGGRLRRLLMIFRPVGVDSVSASASASASARMTMVRRTRKRILTDQSWTRESLGTTVIVVAAWGIRMRVSSAAPIRLTRSCRLVLMILKDKLSPLPVTRESLSHSVAFRTLRSCSGPIR